MPEDERGVAKELSLVLVRDGNSFPAFELSGDALAGTPACLFKVAVGGRQLGQAFHTPPQFISRTSVIKRLSKSGRALDQIRDQLGRLVNCQHRSLWGTLNHLRRQPEPGKMVVCRANPV